MSSRKVLAMLRAFESRNITFQAEDGSWPIVWEQARGMYVRDAEGRRYLDLTAAFGVAAAGHAHRAVVRAGRAQMGRLLHAMGDVHPHARKAELVRALSAITFERWQRGTAPSPAGPGSKQNRWRAAPLTGKSILCNSGFEAVEAALKTALLATGKPGVIAFERAYHGLGYGALNTTHRSHFRSPFLRQLRQFATFVPFPAAPARAAGTQSAPSAEPAAPSVACAASCKEIERLLRRGTCGAILVEPIQVRGGINVPVPGFLADLRRLCDRFGALLILDEIYTGFGRTGRWFACEHDAVVPDLICLGKALTGGFPLSACVGRAEVMDRAWPPSTGEAIHTSTFLGHPVGCAMALAHIEEIRRSRLVENSARRGRFLLARLADLAAEVCSAAPGMRLDVRGLGLVAGLEFRLADGKPATQMVLECITRMLHRGFLLLPEGEASNVIAFTPPLIVTERQLEGALAALAEVIPSAYRQLSGPG